MVDVTGLHARVMLLQARTIRVILVEDKDISMAGETWLDLDFDI